MLSRTLCTEFFAMKPINDTFLRALKREHTDYTPLWLMRQAGRYLPEYNATRARLGSFLALAKCPEAACEVTLQPVDRYGLDAAILFSDILTVPDAMGLGLSFVAGEGPVFAKPVQSEESVNALYVPDIEDSLGYVTEAVRVIRRELNNRVPLIGFSGSPFTLACYMVEGGSSKDFATIKKMMYSRPDLLHRILDVNARAVTAYLNAQIQAGAQAVQIFDTWGGALGRRLLRGIQPEVHEADRRRAHPRKRRREGPGHPLHQGRRLVAQGNGRNRCADCIGLDWTVNLTKARACVQDAVALQGNLDPAVLFADESYHPSRSAPRDRQLRQGRQWRPRL